MQIASFILGIIGTLTGTISLFIKIYEVYNDRARLVIEISLSLKSDEKFQLPYFSLEIIFMNRGRRQITIVDGALELPRGDIVLGGNTLIAESSVQPLFSAGSKTGIVIDSHKRQKFISEPFDASLLRNSGGTVKALFTDAIGGRYESCFSVPPAEHINMISTQWAAFNKKL